MKTCQQAITLVLFSIWSNSAWSGKTPYAVSRFKDLPKYYVELVSRSEFVLYHKFQGRTWPKDITNRDVDDSTRKSSTLKLKEKNSICEEAFKMIEENGPIDPSAHQDMLKSKHRELFNEIFEERCSSRYGMRMRKECDKADKMFHYVNPSKPVTFQIDEANYSESAFACLFLTGQGDDLRHYYVTDHAYNVNDSTRGSPIPGRFIFYNGGVYALAERLPRVSKSREADPATQLTLAEAFWNRRTSYGKDKETVSKDQEDPICKLDEGRKVRLCTYAHMVDSNITPQQWRQNSISVQQDSCEKRTVPFTNGTQFDEWMIVCDHRKSPGSNRSVRVSRGYKDNSVFVSFVDSKRKLDFLYLLDRVSVAVDSK